MPCRTNFVMRPRAGTLLAATYLEVGTASYNGLGRSFSSIDAPHSSWVKASALPSGRRTDRRDELDAGRL